jgi:hypothetical protein
MSDPLNSVQTGDTLDSAFEEERLHRKEAAKMTRMFLFFAAPLIIMIAIVIAVVAVKMSADSRAIAAKAATSKAISVQVPQGAYAQKDTQIAALQSQIMALQGQLRPAEGTAIAPAQPLYSADPGTLAQVSARLDRIEAAQRDLARATAAAYAARNLQLAAQNQQPFLSELAVAEPVLNDPALSATLRPYAEKGVPSAISLAVAFPAAAKQANIAAKADDGKHGLLDKLRHLIGEVISVRRITGGQGTDAILTRAETRLDSGDLKGAVAYLDTLSPAAQKAILPWLEQARARVLVDDTTRRLSETALNRLSQMTSPAATPLTNGGVL